MKETEGIVLNAPEKMPIDPYVEIRQRARKIPTAHADKQHDRLRRFLENDRKVLRFYCMWDDRESMYGELRQFVSVL